MTNVESMDYTHSHPSTIASLSSTELLLPMHYTHHIPFHKSPTIPTYYGIYIAITRYTVMKLPPFHFIMTHTIIRPRPPLIRKTIKK